MGGVPAPSWQGVHRLQPHPAGTCASRLSNKFHELASSEHDHNSECRTPCANYFDAHEAMGANAFLVALMVLTTSYLLRHSAQALPWKSVGDSMSVALCISQPEVHVHLCLVILSSACRKSRQRQTHIHFCLLSCHTFERLQEIQTETDRVTGYNKNVSHNPIRLKIYSPHVL